MKKIIVNNYDKLVLLMSIFILGIVFALQLSTQLDENEVSYASEDPEYWKRSSEGVTLHSSIKNDLMPGDFIYYKQSDSNLSKVKISKVFFKRRSEISVLLFQERQVPEQRLKKDCLSESSLGSSAPLLLDVDEEPQQMLRFPRSLVIQFIYSREVRTTLRQNSLLPK